MRSRSGRQETGQPEGRVSQAARKPLGRRWWPTRTVILIAFVLPLVTELRYDPADTSLVIAEVLGAPLITAWFPGLVSLQVLLGLVALLPFVTLLTRPDGRWQLGRPVLAAYAGWLLLTGLLQNMATTDTYGFAWVLGNSVVSFIVAAFVIHDIVADRSGISVQDFTPKHLWTLLPAALAFFSPYAITPDGTITAGFQTGIFGVQAGVTYCFLTPVFLAVFLSFARGIDRGTLSVIGFAGLGFGLFNLVTWFIFMPASWWMGVLHLPLVILAVVALVEARISRAPLHSRHAGSPPGTGGGISGNQARIT